jgi:hypothetical protein
MKILEVTLSRKHKTKGDCLELADDYLLASDLMNLHNYFQIFSYFILQDTKVH